MFHNYRTIGPDWHHLPNVTAFTTLRLGFDGEIISFSNTENSKANQEQIEKLINPIHPIHWLKQVHENLSLELPESNITCADGSTTKQKKVVCAVRSADCLPIVFSSVEGNQVGVAHGGWKGLYSGIIESVVNKFENPTELLVWLGPAISQDSFEVGPEVYKSFVSKNKKFKTAFIKGSNDRYFADLYEIAKIQLLNLGVLKKNISGGNMDTFKDLDLHSARRDKENSGRMATLVWIK